MKLFGADPTDPLGNTRPLREIRDKIYSHAWSRERRDVGKHDWVVTQWGFNRNVPERYVPETPYATAPYQRLEELPCNLHLANKTISSDFLRYIYTQNSLEVDIDLKAVFTEQGAASFDKLLQLLQNPNFSMYTQVARVRIHFPVKYPLNNLPEFNLKALNKVAATFDNFKQLRHMVIRTVLSQGSPLDYELRVAAFPFYPNKMTDWSIRVLNNSPSRFQYPWDIIGPQQVQVLDKAFNIYVKTDNMLAFVPQDSVQKRFARNKSAFNKMAKSVDKESTNKQLVDSIGNQKAQVHSKTKSHVSSQYGTYKSEHQLETTTNKSECLDTDTTFAESLFVDRGSISKVAVSSSAHAAASPVVGGIHAGNRESTVSKLSANDKSTSISAVYPRSVGTCDKAQLLNATAYNCSASDSRGGRSTPKPTASVAENTATVDNTSLSQEPQNIFKTASETIWPDFPDEYCKVSDDNGAEDVLDSEKDQSVVDMHNLVNTAAQNTKKQKRFSKKYKRPKKAQNTADHVDELAQNSPDELVSKPCETARDGTPGEDESKQHCIQSIDSEAETGVLLLRNTTSERITIRSMADVNRALRRQERQRVSQTAKEAETKRTRELRQSRKAKETVLRRNNLDADSRLLRVLQPRREDDKKKQKQTSDDDDQKLITESSAKKSDIEMGEGLRQTEANLRALRAILQNTMPNFQFSFIPDDDNTHASDGRPTTECQEREAQELLANEMEDDENYHSSGDITPRSLNGSIGSNELLLRTVSPLCPVVEVLEDMQNGSATYSTLRDDTESSGDKCKDPGAVDSQANSSVEAARDESQCESMKPRHKPLGGPDCATGHGSSELVAHQATSKSAGLHPLSHDDDKRRGVPRNRGYRRGRGDRQWPSHRGGQASYHQVWGGGPELASRQEHQAINTNWRAGQGQRRPYQHYQQENRFQGGSRGRYGFSSRSQTARDSVQDGQSETRNRWSAAVLDGDEALRARRQEKQLELQKDMMITGKNYSSYSSRITDHWTKTDEDDATVAKSNERIVYDAQS